MAHCHKNVHGYFHILWTVLKIIPEPCPSQKQLSPRDLELGWGLLWNNKIALLRILEEQTVS